MPFPFWPTRTRIPPPTPWESVTTARGGVAVAEPRAMDEAEGPVGHRGPVPGGGGGGIVASEGGGQEGERPRR